MAFYASMAEALQATRDRLTEITGGQNNPENLGKKTGFLDYAFSGANPTGVRQKMLDNENADNYRPVQITYYQRDFGADVIEDDTEMDCDPGTQKPKQIAVVEPALFVAEKVTIEEHYMREVIDGGEEKVDDMIKYHLAPKMRVLRERANQKLFTKAGASMGANPGAGGTGVGQPGEAGNYQDVTLLNADGTINDESFDVIKNQMEDNYLGGNFAAIGLGNMRKYHNRLGISEINDDGVDYRELINSNGYGFVKDQTTTAALGGADRFLTIAPGFVQPYHYNLNRGDYNFEITATEGKGIMPDPVYPQIQWDMDYAYIRCAGPNTMQGKYVIRLWLYHDLFVVPTGVFAAGDELAGMNGIFGFNAVKAAPAP